MMGLYSYKQRQKDTEWATSIECTRKDCMPANDADDGSDVAVAFGIRVSRTVCLSAACFSVYPCCRQKRGVF